MVIEICLALRLPDGRRVPSFVPESFCPFFPPSSVSRRTTGRCACRWISAPSAGDSRSACPCGTRWCRVWAWRRPTPWTWAPCDSRGTLFYGTWWPNRSSAKSPAKKNHVCLTDAVTTAGNQGTVRVCKHLTSNETDGNPGAIVKFGRTFGHTDSAHRPDSFRLRAKWTVN